VQISGAAAVQLDLFFAASHSMEPGRNAVWAACGVTSTEARRGRAQGATLAELQTKIDGRRVERIDRIGEIETQILVGVQPSRLGDQSLSQFRVDAPVARFICSLIPIASAMRPERQVCTGLAGWREVLSRVY
jgi:hypothetical protein